MKEKIVRSEYSDGSFIEALVVGGHLMCCPIIKISPPEEWGNGAMTLDQACFAAL